LLLLLYCYQLLFEFDRGAVPIAAAGYIADHCCFMFDRGVVHIVVAVILFPITVSGLTDEWSILLRLVILLTNAVLCLTEECFILLWL
jgi:hypothetical protein